MKAYSVVVLHIRLKRTIQSMIGWKHCSTGKFGLERMKKRFGVCIVAWPPDAGTLQQAQLCYLRAKGRSHVLRSSITMEDHAAPGSVTRCVYEHRARDRRSATVRQRPREDTPREEIHHDGEIAPRGADPEIRDVADPHLIGGGNGRVPEPVRMSCVEMVHLRLRPITSHRFRAKPRSAHEPRDPASAHEPARIAHQLI